MSLVILAPNKMTHLLHFCEFLLTWLGALIDHTESMSLIKYFTL